MKHLSDDMIQEYLDSRGLSHSEVINNHQVICPSCQDKLERYKELYLQLSEEPELELGGNFNMNVIKSVDALESKAGLKMYFYSLAAAMGVFMVLFALDYLGTISVSAIYLAVSTNISGWLTPTVNMVSDMIKKLNGNIEILAFAGIAALIFQVLDRNIIQAKLKRL